MAVASGKGDFELGDIDYLVVDAPSGTGDEPLSVRQLVPAVVMTTPQNLSVPCIRRSVGFCRRLRRR